MISEKMKQYMNRGLIILTLNMFFVPQVSFGQTTFSQMIDRVEKNAQEIKNIEYKIIDIKDNYKLLYDGAKNQNDQLGLQISYGNYIVAGFGIFLTLLGIFIAWFVNQQYEKIKKMKNIVESTKEYIQHHNKELYNAIKRDETLDIINRLKKCLKIF